MDPIQIFISYAREDQGRVKELYHRLVAAGFHPWLDREHILPGQKWEPIIKQALKRSDFVLVCLSVTSINKRGFLQKEIKTALEHMQEKLEADVWLIPARLDLCDVPESMSAIQWVDLFEHDGFEQLLRALEFQLKKLGKSLPSASSPQASSSSQSEQGTVTKSERATIAFDASIFSFVTVKVDEKGDVIEQESLQARSLIEDLGGSAKLEMVELLGGEFWMGSSDTEAQAALAYRARSGGAAELEWYTRETPRHRVKVSPFLMGKYPITQSQWYVVMGVLPEIADDLRGDHHPVVNVSWEEAVEFCLEVTRRTNRQYRLPTEAEWEYACRAGTITPFSFGSTLSPEIANYWWYAPYGNGPKKDPLRKTVSAGSMRVANTFGLFDMHGNVWEWCSDWFSSSYYEECRKQDEVSDPRGPSAGSIRVSRGGSWYKSALLCRSAVRNYDLPGYRGDDLGFRLVRVGS